MPPSPTSDVQAPSTPERHATAGPTPPEAEAQLRRGVHEASLRRLGGYVVHDLRGTLNTPVISLEVLRVTAQTLVDPEPLANIERHLRTIRNGLGAHRDLLEAVLVWSGLIDEATWHRDAADPFDWAEGTRRVPLLVESFCKRGGIRLELEVPQHAVPILGDAGAVDEAVLAVALLLLEAAFEGGDPKNPKVVPGSLSVGETHATFRLQAALNRPEIVMGAGAPADEPPAIRFARLVARDHRGRFQALPHGREVHVELELPLARAKN